MIKFNTREEWLNAAITEFRPLFEATGVGLPAKIRVTCGFPSTFRRSKKTTEFFRSESSADGTFEVLVAPTIAEKMEVAAALWGVLGEMTLQSQPFEGMTELVESLGDYPHAKIIVDDRPSQGTRMLKASCPTCGMIIRLTQKWSATLPVCSADGSDFVLEAST